MNRLPTPEQVDRAAKVSKLRDETHTRDAEMDSEYRREMRAPKPGSVAESLEAATLAALEHVSGKLGPECADALAESLYDPETQEYRIEVGRAAEQAGDPAELLTAVLAALLEKAKALPARRRAQERVAADQVSKRAWADFSQAAARHARRGSE